MAKLDSILTLRRRFLRSVSLERDAHTAAGLDGYIPTPTGLSALARIESALNDPSSRAVTITGPYGTGKSAFALYLTSKLATAPLGQRENGLFPVLITGGREPIIPALLRGLEVSLHGQASFDVDDCTAKEVAARFSAATAEVKKRGCSGLLVILDELGKFLEFAAQHPEKSDLQVLQEMAEMAVRSDNEAPVLFVTILHQSFDEYAHRLSAVQRSEWQKVQGRFLDIPFGDSTEDSVRLIGRAFEGEDTSAKKRAKDQAKRAKPLKILPRTIEEPADIFAGAFGLHPVTILALPHLFKRFGQSERTLFSFLNSDDPHGFGTFLHENSQECQYRIDELYDYAVATLSSTLYTSPGYGRLWSQVQEAVYRCENLGGLLEARIVKTVGLLHLLGESARLLPSREVISFALEDKDTSEQDIQVALDRLTRATVLIFRPFKNAYRPYEGSDIDVEERLKEARSAIGTFVSPASVAEKRQPFAPVIARRHSFRTGTLRFFELRACEVGELDGHLAKMPEQADGLLVLCLTADRIEQEAVIALAQELTKTENDRPNVVVAVARLSEALHETAFLVEALEWVRDNTPELKDDLVASREVRERQREAFHAFESQWSRLLLPGFETEFVWQGQHVDLKPTGHALQSLLSEACYAAYPNTPTLRNEILNRRQLSSTAAGARRNLIEAMIQRRHLPNLGIEGYPAERMMYETILAASGLHGPQAESEDWLFYPSVKQGDPRRLSHAWNKIEQFLLGGDLTPKSVNDLYATLRARPYGLTDGVLPVLLIAALLCWEDEILLYEDGALVTQLEPALAERLLRRPQDYTIQGVRIAGERQAVVTRFSQGLLRGVKKKTLVNVVKAIYAQVNKLPVYTRTTRTLSSTSIGLRDALKDARSPEKLLFIDLPKLFDLQPFTAEPNPQNVEAFFQAWNKSFSELTSAYDALLARLRSALLEAFEAEFIDEIRDRAEALSGRVMEPKLVGFVTRLADRMLNGEAWIESLAAGIVGRVPETWGDAEESKYLTALPSLLSGFRSAEQVAFAMTIAQSDAEVEERVAMRVSVAAPGGHEDARVVIMPRRRAQRAQEAAEKIKKYMGQHVFKGEKVESAEVQVAALAYLIRELLQENEKEK